MTPRAQKVLEEAMTLPEDERSSVAIALLDSTREFDDAEVDPGAEAAWDAEIDKRIAEIDSGKVVGLTYDEMRAQLKAKHPWLR